MKKISFINKIRNINTLDELFYKITQKINLLLTFPKGGFTRYPVDVFMKKISSTKQDIEKLYSDPKSVLTPEKMQSWVALQVVKLFLGMPIVPGK